MASHSYPILTFRDVPDIQIDIVDRPRDPTGARLRVVPLSRERMKEVLARGQA